MNKEKIGKIAGKKNLDAFLLKFDIAINKIEELNKNDGEKGKMVEVFDSFVKEMSKSDKKFDVLEEKMTELIEKSKNSENITHKDISDLKSSLSDEIEKNTPNIKTEKVSVDMKKTNALLSLMKTSLSNLEFPKTFFKEYLDKFLVLLSKKDEEPYKEEAIKENGRITEVIYYYKDKIVTEKILRTAGKIIREKHEKQV